MKLKKAYKILGADAQKYSSLPKQEAYSQIIQSLEKIRMLKDEMDQDEELHALQTKLKDIKETYTSAISYNQAIISVILSNM